MNQLFTPDDPYLRFLELRKGSRFFMKSWLGNSGDLLIWQATEAILSDLGIELVLDPAAADYILVAGGNQTMWEENVAVWRESSRRFPGAKLIIGPGTVKSGYSSWLEFVKSPESTVEAIFTRDPASHRLLEECGLGPAVTIGLSHDPVFYRLGTPWLEAQRSGCAEDHIVVAFRKDYEGKGLFDGLFGGRKSHRGGAVARKLRKAGVKLSREMRIRAVRRKYAGQAIVVRDVSRMLLPCFLETLRAARLVHTDRLHVMIMAAMLGKPVHAHGTGYGKLEAVYDHSMMEWARVTFESWSSS